MTDEQKTAIRNPCIEAEDCTHPRFRTILKSGLDFPAFWSAILTVNSGFESLERFDGLPVWHASVALWRNLHGPASTRTWTASEMGSASLFMSCALSGVGGETVMDEVGEVAIHRRIRLTPAEILALSRVNPRCPVFTHGKAAWEHMEKRA